MTDDMHSEIGKLHTHIDHVQHQIGEVKKGQDNLHREHLELRDRVDVLERNVIRDIDNLTAHEREADIRREYLMDGFERLSGTVKSLDTRFQAHADKEEEDRKDVIKGLRMTVRSVIGTGITILSTVLVLLWQTGVLS